MVAEARFKADSSLPVQGRLSRGCVLLILHLTDAPGYGFALFAFRGHARQADTLRRGGTEVPRRSAMAPAAPASSTDARPRPRTGATPTVTAGALGTWVKADRSISPRRQGWSEGPNIGPTNTESTTSAHDRPTDHRGRNMTTATTAAPTTPMAGSWTSAAPVSATQQGCGVAEHRSAGEAHRHGEDQQEHQRTDKGVDGVGAQPAKS